MGNSGLPLGIRGNREREIEIKKFEMGNSLIPALLFLNPRFLVLRLQSRR